MNNVDGSLSFKADLDNMDFKAKIKEIINLIGNVSSTTVKETSTMDSAFRKLAAVAGGVFTFAGAKQFVSDVIRVRGEFQQLEIAFTTMLRSKERADKLMAEAIELASTTPFTLQDVASGAKQLLAYGTSAEEVTKSIKMIGDVASGVGAPLNDLIYLYGTLRASGRATTIDIRQFAGRGIPIYEELSKVVGKSGNELKEWIEQGKVGFAEVEKAFQGMTTEGGMFFNLMQEQSKSVTGRISNLQDAWSQMLNEIGKSSEGTIYSAVSGLNSLVANYKTVGAILAGLITTYGSYKAAVMALTVVERIRAAGLVSDIATKKTVFSLEVFLTNTTKRLAAAQALLNKTMLANPYVAVGAALVGIATYLLLTRERTEELSEAQKEFQQQSRDSAAEMTALFDALKRTASGTTERRKAIEAVNSKYGEYLGNLLTEKSTLDDIRTAEKLAMNAMIDRLASESKMKDLNEVAKKQLEIRKDLVALNADVDVFQTLVEKTKGDKEFMTLWKGLYNSESTAILALSQDYRKLLGEQQAVESQYDKLTKQYRSGQEPDASKTTKTFKSVGDAVKEVNDQITNLESKRDSLPEWNTKGVSEYNNQIEKARQKLAILKGENRGELSPMGSIKYWEDVKNKAEAALKSLSPDDKDLRQKTEKYIGEIEQAQKEIDALEFDLKPFDDQLQYRREQYDQYFKWVQHYGKETADKQFTDLLGMGADYSAFLARQQKSLQDIQNRTPQQNDQLLKVTIEIEKLQSPEAQLEAFTQKIENTRKQAQNLTAFLATLSSEQQALLTDFSPSALAKQNEVENQIKDTQSTIQKQYDNMLLSLQVFYNKYEAVKRDSSRKLAEISTNVDTGVITPEQGQIEIDVVYTGQAQAIEQLSRDVNLRISEFEKFVGQIDQIAKAQLSGFVSQVNDIINIPELDTIRTQVLDQIAKARELQNFDTEAGAQNYKDSINALTDTLINAGGQAGELGRKIASTMKAIDKVKASGIIPVDYEVSTDQAIEQINLISEAVQNVTGVNIDFDLTDSNASIDQITAKVAELRQRLSENFGITISAEGDISEQIDTLKKSLNATLGISIDKPKTAEEVTAMITAVQQLLANGVVLPVEVQEGADLDALLQKYQGYVEKRKSIEVSYNSDIKSLTKAYNSETDINRKQQIAESITQRKKAYDTEKDNLNESLGNFQSYYSQIEQLGRKSMLTQIKNLKTEAQAIKDKYGESSDEYQKFTSAIDNAETAVLVSDIDKVGFGLSKAAEIAKAMGGEFGETAGKFADMAIQAISFTTALASGDYLGAISSFVGMIVSAISEMQTDYDRIERRALKIQEGELELNRIYRDRLQSQAEITRLQYEQLNAIKESASISLSLNTADIESILQKSKDSLAQFVQGFAVKLNPAFMSVYLDNIARYAVQLNQAGQSLNGQTALQAMDLEAYYALLQELALKGLLSESDQTFYEMLTKLKEEGMDLNDVLDETIRKQQELMAGTTASTIAQQIAQGFAAGKRSAADFADTFEDLLKQAFISQLQFRVIEPLIQQFFDDLAASNFITGGGRPGANGFVATAVSNEGTTPKDLLTAGFNNAISIASEYIKGFEAATGLSLGGADITTMQGAIKGITEESASIIAGQFNAMRIIQFGILDSVNKSLTHLAQIQFNTMVSATELKKLNRKFSGNSATGREYGG